MIRRSLWRRRVPGHVIGHFQAKVFVDVHIQRCLRIQRCVLGAKHRNTLGELRVVGHLPGVGARRIAERLRFGIAVGELVITDTRTEFEAEAMNRTVQELTTITCGEDIALTIAVVAVSQPACLDRKSVV